MTDWHPIKFYSGSYGRPSPHFHLLSRISNKKTVSRGTNSRNVYAKLKMVLCDSPFWSAGVLICKKRMQISAPPDAWVRGHVVVKEAPHNQAFTLLRANTVDQWIPQTLLVVCAFDGCRSCRPLFSRYLLEIMLKVKLSEFERKKKKSCTGSISLSFSGHFNCSLAKKKPARGACGSSLFWIGLSLVIFQGYEFSRVLWAPFCSPLKGRCENFMLPHTPRKDAESSSSTCYLLLLKTHACEWGVLFYLLSFTTNDFWSSNIGVFFPLTQNTLRRRKSYLLSFTANRSFWLFWVFFLLLTLSECRFGLSFSSLFFIFLTTTLLLLTKRTLLVIGKQR